MSISKAGLKGIVDRMTAKLDAAEKNHDATAALLIARVLACAAHQLTLEDGDDRAIKTSAETLLVAQAVLGRYEEQCQA